MKVQLVRAMRFSAAHCVPTSPREKSRRIHGHNFSVALLLGGVPDPQRGWLIDFADIRSAFAPLAEKLDHAYLNDLKGLAVPDIPSLETWVSDAIKSDLSDLSGILERAVITIESDLDFALRKLHEDNRLDLPARLAFTLESAHRLPNAGSDHKCSRLHGHSFRIEVGASDLDRLRGPLRGIYDRLDHRYLNEIEGLENPTSENLACWIWRELERDVPRRTGQTGQMGRTGRRGQTGQTVVVVRESPETACVYRGE